MAGAAALAALCGCGASDEPPSQIATVRVASGQTFTATRVEATRAFVAEHGDEYDMLVFWDTNNLFNGQFSYTPIANDVLGVGYGHDSDEVFSDRDGLSTVRLQGVIWMGNRWMTIDVEPGPESIFGILAEETVHRWAARVYYDDAGVDSDAILDTLGRHWSALLDVGNSPLGGAVWTHLGAQFYESERRGPIAYADVDLYLMGVLPASDVAPLQLLVDVWTDDCAQPAPCSDSWPDVAPTMVQATAETVTIEQVIAVEGAREPTVGEAPSAFRQAWVYVVYDQREPSAGDLETLEARRHSWETFFNEAARGLAEISTDL